MTKILEANKISFNAVARDKPILYETDIIVRQGEFVIILGHNGSGKSSLIKILSGEKSPSFGEILLNNVPLNRLNPANRAKQIVTLAQKAEDGLFLDLTLEENITLWESRFEKFERHSFEQVIEHTNNARRFLPKAKQLVRDLSGGEKQSILLGLALSHPPKILFLDEHTASLDPKASDKIMKATNAAVLKHNITTLMVTHRLDDALDYGNRIIVMKEGRIVIDQPKFNNFSKQDMKDMMQ